MQTGVEVVMSWLLSGFQHLCSDHSALRAQMPGQLIYDLAALSAEVG